MQTKTANLILDDKSVQLPIVLDSFGAVFFDVSVLSQQGWSTLDRGLANTSTCYSAITYIDGEKGLLSHRGHKIESLVKQYDYLDVVYLLWYGKLPSAPQKKNWCAQIQVAQMLHPAVEKALQAQPKTNSPMTLLMSMVATQAGLLAKNNLVDTMNSVVAQMPLWVAACYRHHTGQPLLQPKSELDYGAQLVYLLFGESPHMGVELTGKILQAILILHADHEQNASTSTVRMVGSTGADVLSSVLAGIAALSGPAHGGANEAVLHMLKNIGTPDQIPAFLEEIKTSQGQSKLMGFGHRVYKSYDPRASVLKDLCQEIFSKTGDNPLFKVAQVLEATALSDEYFIKRKLYPNVDFYSGLLLTALGLPTNSLTTIFALARTAGWLAHFAEMIQDPTNRISRPKQCYIGPLIVE